jgi:hypothetical protein
MKELRRARGVWVQNSYFHFESPPSTWMVDSWDETFCLQCDRRVVFRFDNREVLGVSSDNPLYWHPTAAYCNCTEVVMRAAPLAKRSEK